MCAFSYGGRVKIRDEATVRSKASYFALAVLPDGTRDILGCGSSRPKAPRACQVGFSACGA